MAELCRCGHVRARHGTPLIWYPWLPLPPEGVCSHIAPPGTDSVEAVRQGCRCQGWSPDAEAKPFACEDERCREITEREAAE